MFAFVIKQNIPPIKDIGNICKMDCCVFCMFVFFPPKTLIDLAVAQSYKLQCLTIQYFYTFP